MNAILNHMPLWAGCAIVGAIVVGLVVGWLLVRWL